MKIDILNYTFDINTFNNIIERRKFFCFEYSSLCLSDNFHSFDLIHPPTESIYKKLGRLLFTNNPPPYHYDFYMDCSPELAKRNFFFKLKQRFGYSVRSSTYFTSISKSKSNSIRNSPIIVKYLSLTQRNKVFPS